MRVAILATGWAGFNDAASRALAARGVELLLVHHADAPDTAYTEHRIAEHAQVHEFTGEPQPGEIRDVVAAFAPDAVLMHSWHVPAYREAVKALPRSVLRVLWMDNVWRGTAKQWVGRAIAPVWVRSLFDVVMVPSDRSEFFARRLGFGEDAVIRGSLSADTTLFGLPEGTRRSGAELAGRHRFLACLRLVHHKGADVLAEAYRSYREHSSDPWDLDVVGIGPLAEHLEGVDGVTMHGFLQPAEVAPLMREVSALVVPSREDPFGVVLHEGALSGLPIVSTYFVGAAPLYVQDGQNGWVVPREDPAVLAAAMTRLAAQPAERLEAMSAVSQGLGGRLSSEGWARNLHEQLDWRTAALRARRA